MKKQFKRALALLSSATMLLAMLSVIVLPAAAETYSGTCGENLTWSLDTVTGVLTINGDGELYGSPWSEYVDIIQTVQIGDGVTSIGWSEFEDCGSLTSITIPDSVTYIDGWAFLGCSNLASVTIPKGVTSIGYRAFEGCSSLASVTIGEGVTSIDGYAFYNCSSLASIVIPKGVTSVMGATFCGCSSLASVTIPGGVTSIDWDAFRGCSSLTSVTIPDSVANIGEGAFSNCSSLASIVIPKGVTSIERATFMGCSSLATAMIPDSVTGIGDEAFWGCSSLTSITIPNSVTSIGESVFYGTAYYNDDQNWENGVLYIGNHLIKVESISGDYTVKSGIKTIAGGAFSFCRSLTSVTIPSSVTGIGRQTFSYCDDLAHITVDENNSVYHSAGNCLIETASKTLIAGCKNSIIPSDGSVTVIGNSAFYGCSSLASIAIPDSVTSIGASAFCNCSSLASIAIPDSVTSIGDYAFENCECLTSVTISKGVTSIGHWAFEECSSLVDIYFLGTQSEWDAVEKEDAEISETVTVHCFCIVSNDVIAHYADGHAFDEGVTLSAAVRDDVVLPADLAECENAVVLDITLQKEGEAVQPDSAVTVCVPVPQGMDAAICRVFRLEADGSVTDMQAKTVGDHLYYTTEHFSLYVIAEQTAPAAALGDVDGDTEITSTDARLVLQYYAKKIDETKLDISVADVDGDTEITSTDARLILQYYAKKITEFPTKK